MPTPHQLSKHFKRAFPLLAATTGLLISQCEAKALNLKTFDLQWSPNTGSQGAINGKITLDLDSISLPSNGENQPIPAWATDLSVVVSGTGGNNGTFVQSDFDSWVFDNNGISFDFSQDLVGQGGWGTTCKSPSSGGCDFNLFSGSGPSGSGFFKLASGTDSFLLSKFAPAGANTGVPVPGPMPVVGAVAAFGWSRRLRKRIATPLSTSPQA
jgi:hypothetical protein